MGVNGNAAAFPAASCERRPGWLARLATRARPEDEDGAVRGLGWLLLPEPGGCGRCRCVCGNDAMDLVAVVVEFLRPGWTRAICAISALTSSALSHSGPEHFVSKSRSFDSLNVSMHQGRSPLALQMRITVSFPPHRLAIDCVVHAAEPSLGTVCSRHSRGICGLRSRPGATAPTPATPDFANRSRQRRTVF